MGTPKGAALRIVSELRVFWCVVCFVVETLIVWMLYQIPPIKARLMAAREQRCQMSSFAGNWQVRALTRIVVIRLRLKTRDEK